jgi:hypothetical protein
LIQPKWHEPLHLARRVSVGSLVDGIAREHSRKPEEAYRPIEELDFQFWSWRNELGAIISRPQHFQYRTTCCAAANHG